MTAPKTVLVLRTCKSDGTSNGGFQWPESGPVECPDWNPSLQCGNGLHGALWGEGTGSLFRWESDARWLVVQVRARDVVDLKGKVKFPRGVVVHSGDRLGATAYLSEHGGAGRAIIGGTSTSGYRGTSTSVYRGTSTSGYGGTSTSGIGGTSTSGIGGTSTSGYRGTSTSGGDGTSTSGRDGTSTSGYGGIIELRWYAGSRDRIAIGYIGEGGLEPNVAYRCDKTGQIVRADA